MVSKQDIAVLLYFLYKFKHLKIQIVTEFKQMKYLHLGAEDEVPMQKSLFYTSKEINKINFD